VPDILVGTWFVVLPSRNAVTPVALSESQCHLPRRCMNMGPQVVRQIVDVLEVLIWNYDNVAFIVFPKVRTYEGRYKSVPVDYILLPRKDSRIVQALGN